ncbi:MAG: hypothetical protein ACRC7O_16315 [Fimbriiglobus sp.]
MKREVCPMAVDDPFAAKRQKTRAEFLDRQIAVGGSRGSSCRGSSAVGVGVRLMRDAEVAAARGRLSE